MNATERAAAVVAAAALTALAVPLPLAALALGAVAVVTVVDALAVRRRPDVARTLPRLLARGIPARFFLEREEPRVGRARLRQPVPPDLYLEPDEAEERLEGRLSARRRGRHAVPAPAVRVDGPLGLGRWHHRAGEGTDVVVYPDLPTAYRLVGAVRRARFGDPGRRRRGPLGLGTDFESIRDYVPDDDVRQVNWRATARVGRPMSNQYRLERDRDVICVVDCGRLMAAPIGEATRLDLAVDAVAAIAAVADEVGDRCGVLAFDDTIRRNLAPRRRGSRAVIQAVFDLEPRSADSDFELAFRVVQDMKRAFVLVLTDLLEPAAARILVGAVPLLARSHAVSVASVRDPDLDTAVTTEPRAVVDVYRAAVALGVLGERDAVAAQLRGAGATVVEAAPRQLPAACVGSYLRAKARARL